MDGGVETPGKIIRNGDKISLLFSNDNGRYFITASSNEVSISLTGEVGYSLVLNEKKTTYLSVSYGGNNTYPVPVTTHYLRFSLSETSGILEAEYSTSDYDENYDGCEEDDREETHLFTLSWIVKQ